MEVRLTHLRNVSSVYLPVEGKYAVGSSKKPRKDWNERRDLETSTRLTPLVDDLTHVLVEAGKNKLQ
ncbi:MAG TPA: hypothetical protein VGW77_00795 [Candidatus Binatia bacterium]|nr:hypothetical protein [Candidatus Binatia bacterium]